MGCRAAPWYELPTPCTASRRIRRRRRLCGLCADVAAFRRRSAGRGNADASVPSVPAPRRRRAAAVLILALVLAGCSELDDLDELTGAPPDPPEPIAPDVRPDDATPDGAEPQDAGPTKRTKLPAAVEQPEPAPTAYPDDPAAPACAGDDLDVQITGFDAAAGSRYLSLEATNASGHPCAVQGAPALEFGRLSGTTTPRVTFPALCRGFPPRVVVPDGQELHAAVEWNAMSTSLDPDVTVEVRVRTTPDGSLIALPLDEVPLYDGRTLDQIDVLDGAEVEVGWWQVDPNVWTGCPVAP